MSRWPLMAEDQDGQPDPVAEQIASALVVRGFVVDRAVGQSHFRCDLAVRCKGDAAYRLAILLDNDGYYDQSDLLERDLMRPKLLRDFGWRVAFVLAKDWYEDRDAVLDRLSRLLVGDEEPVEDEEKADERALEVADTEQFQATIHEVEGDSSTRLPPESEARVAASEAVPLETSSVGEDPVADVAHSTGAATVENSTRRFEFTGGKSNKFWEITLTGAQHTVRFGRIGSKGQNVTKTFENAASARRDCERLIRAKKAKGYREMERPIGN
jgi:predicted DNA-binding WGR domain protein